MLVFKRKCFLLYCKWSHLENYSLLLHSAKSTPGFRAGGVRSPRGHAHSIKINEVCHFIISFCQGKVKGSTPAKAKFPEQANTSEHTERGPVFPEMFIPAEQRWWEAPPAGAGLPGSARAHSPASAQCHRPAPHTATTSAQQSPEECKWRENLIGKKKEIPHILSQLCKVSLYKSWVVQAYQLFPHSSLLQIGFLVLHCIRFICWRQKMFLHWALMQRRTRNPSLLSACVHFPTLRLKLQMLCLSCTAEWHPTAFPHQPPSYSGLITPSTGMEFQICVLNDIRE